MTPEEQLKVMKATSNCCNAKIVHYPSDGNSKSMTFCGKCKRPYDVEDVLLGAMLKAVIDAQCNGGYTRFRDAQCEKIIDMSSEFSSSGEGVTSILRILLDTNGCKAAYGEEGVCKDCGEDYVELSHPCDTCDGIERFGYCSRIIMEAWHSEEGNNWKAAIETAYNLLQNG